MKHQNQTGFTIAELLVVIVVIAILATISIVSYTGIQERARASKAKVNAETVKRVAEAYFARNNTYPTSVSQFRSGLVTLPSDIQIHRIGTFDASVGENTVAYKYVGTASSAPGACIYYWSFTPIDSPATWPGKPANGQPGRTEPEFLGSATLSTCSAASAAGTIPSL